MKVWIGSTSERTCTGPDRSAHSARSWSSTGGTRESASGAAHLALALALCEDWTVGVARGAAPWLLRAPPPSAGHSWAQLYRHTVGHARKGQESL